MLLSWCGFQRKEFIPAIFIDIAESEVVKPPTQFRSEPFWEHPFAVPRIDEDSLCHDLIFRALLPYTYDDFPFPVAIHVGGYELPGIQVGLSPDHTFADHNDLSAQRMSILSAFTSDLDSHGLSIMV